MLYPLEILRLHDRDVLAVKIRSGISGLLFFMLVAACGDRAEQHLSPGAGQDSGPGSKESPDLAPSVSFATLRQQILDGKAEVPVWEQALAEDASGLLASILELEDPELRHGHVSSFFYYLSKSDPHLAASLLPDELTILEQNHWGHGVVRDLAKTGDIQSAVELAYSSKFSNVERRWATTTAARALGADKFSAEDVLEFWSLLEEGVHRDKTADSVGSVLAKKSPEKAVAWFESLEPGAREYALSHASLAGVTREQIVRQLSAAKDSDLREKLAAVYGKRLRWDVEDPAEAAAVISRLPEPLIASAEVAYIEKFMSRAGGNMPDADAVRKYLPHVLTQEGRDAAHHVIVGDEFTRNRERGVTMLLETGLAERDLDLWRRYIGVWLKTDGKAASTFVSNLPQGDTKRKAIEAVVDYMQRIGDREAEKAWRHQLKTNDSR